MNKGIVGVNEELVNIFNGAVKDDTRFIKVFIDFEKLEFVFVESFEMTSSVEQDFEQASGVLEKDTPTIVLFKLEPKWIVISCVPDESQVRHKMVYASAKNQLKTILGTPKFGTDLFITSVEECSLQTYQSNMRSEDNDVTLTTNEVTIAEEAKDSFPRQVKSVAMKMLDFPAQESAVEGFVALQTQAKDAVVFSIDMEKENLIACKAFNGKLQDVVAEIIPQEPSYVLYNWAHEDLNGKSVKAMIFVFYCPDDAHPRKKMTYSTVKKNILSACAGLDIAVEHKFEFSEMAEFDQEQLMNNLYPQRVEKVIFSRPKGPGARGTRRVKKFQL